MSTTARMEQVADMVAYYRTGRGLEEVGLRVGFSANAVMRAIHAYGGVRARTAGHYAQQPRLNEYASPETWRCTRCRRGATDGAIPSSQRPYCRACVAAYHRARYHRTRERSAS